MLILILKKVKRKLNIYNYISSQLKILKNNIYITVMSNWHILNGNYGIMDGAYK